MIDFNRKPSSKSTAETEFDALNNQYADKFGKPYVFRVGIDAQTWEEAIADIARRISENDPQPAPDYNTKYVY